MGKRISATQRLRQWLDENRPAAVDPALFEQIRRAIEPIEAGRLRRLLRESGLALHPLVEGVRQESPEALERTLAALSEVYEAGTLEMKRRCRDEVIEARQHALWAQARLAGAERAEREGMRATMLVWLENPGVFAAWAAARRRLAATAIPESEPE
ncbi:MAG: hypothetical protein IPJ98_21440 [Bryobacterales bacterium]|nr:hypothetical protein [Bryobacterales bacterium]